MKGDVADEGAPGPCQEPSLHAREALVSHAFGAKSLGDFGLVAWRYACGSDTRVAFALVTQRRRSPTTGRYSGEGARGPCHEAQVSHAFGAKSLGDVGLVAWRHAFGSDTRVAFALVAQRRRSPTTGRYSGEGARGPCHLRWPQAWGSTRWVLATLSGNRVAISP